MIIYGFIYLYIRNASSSNVQAIPIVGKQEITDLEYLFLLESELFTMRVCHANPTFRAHHAGFRNVGVISYKYRVVGIHHHHHMDDYSMIHDQRPPSLQISE